MLRNLLILRNDKMEKTCKNPELRYTVGTRIKSEKCVRPLK